MPTAAFDEIVTAPPPSGKASFSDIVDEPSGKASLSDIVESPEIVPHGTPEPAGLNPNLARRRTAAERRAEAQPTTVGEIAQGFKEMATAPAIPLSNLAPENPTGYAGNIAKAGLQFAEVLTSPLNAAIMVATGGLGTLGTAGAAAQKAVSLYFGLDMLNAAATESPELKAAWDAKDYPKASGILTKMGLTVGAGSLALLHAGSRESVPATVRSTANVPSKPEVTPKVGEPGPVLNRAARRAGVAPPAEGPSIPEQQIPVYRDQLAAMVADKPYSELSQTEQGVVDAMISEGHTGEPIREKSAEEPVRKSTTDSLQVTNGDQSVTKSPVTDSTQPEIVTTPEAQVADVPPPADVRAAVTSRIPSTAPVVGNATEVKIPGERTRYEAVYALREAEDVYPSHNPITFEKNPDYQHVNDRNYREPQAAQRIVQQVAEFDPDYLVTDNKTAKQGPPVIDANGNVLGGNSRVLTLNRLEAQNPGAAQSYRDLVIKQAAQFGLDPEAARSMRRPILVREVTQDLPDAQRAITDLNKKGTAELKSAEQAIADSRRVTTRTLDDITGRIDEQGPEGTLSQAISGNAKSIIENLVQDGVVTIGEKIKLINADGTLTPAGKTRVSQLMIGRLFEDSTQFDEAPLRLREKLERVIAPLTRASEVPGWDITGPTKEAAAIASEAARRGINVEDLLAQPGMFGPTAYTEAGSQIALKLREKGTDAAKAFRQYAAEAELGAEGQQMLGIEPPTQVESFREAFKPTPEGAAGSKVETKLDALEKQLKKRISKKIKAAESTASAGPGLAAEILADYAALGAVKIAKGAVKFKDWSSEMVADLGEKIRPHLGPIWMRAQALHKKTFVESIREAPPTPPVVRENRTTDSGPSVSPSYDKTKGNILERLSPESQAGMRASLADFEARNPERRIVTFGEIQNQARDLDPKILEDLDVKKLKEGETLDPAVRKAAFDRLTGIGDELERRASTPREGMTAEQQAEAAQQDAVLEADARRLTDVLLPTRSQDGRNLAYHRMMAEGSFDANYWVERARKALAIPEGVKPSEDVIKGVQEITKRGREAEANAVDRVSAPTRDRARKEAEAQAEKELGPAPRRGDRRTVDASGAPLPTLEERQARYRQRVLEIIKEKMAGEQKPRATSKWQLTPEERKAVDRDPAVRQARTDLARHMASLQRASWREYFLALRSAGLLTALGTHARNVTSTAAFQAFSEAARIPAMVADSVINSTGKGAGVRTVQAPSLKAIARAVKEGATKGREEAAQIWKTGEVPDTGTDLIDISAELNGRYLFEGKPVLKNFAWTVDAINQTFRALKAEDRFFKRYAFRRALEDEMKAAGVTTPTEDMMVQAWQEADFQTFNNRNQAAQLLNESLSKAEQKGIAGKAFSSVIKFIIPYRNTPANIWMRSIEGTGAGVPMAAVRTLTHEGKLNVAQQRAISMQFGRGALGAGMIMTGFFLYKNGYMTGLTPSGERGQKETRRAAGQQDGAIKLGDKWISLTGLSPVANSLVIGATLGRYYENVGDLFTSPHELALLASATVKEQPMLKGIQDIQEAFETQSATQAAGSAAGSMIPSVVSEVGDLTDQYQRRPETVEDYVKRRIPGVRQTLPPRLDIMGEPTPQSRLASTLGFTTTTDKTGDSVLKALVENEVPVGVSPQQKGETDQEFKARKAANSRATRKKAESDSEYADRLRREGVAIKGDVYRLMQTSRFQNSDKEDRREMIRAAISTARQRIK